MLPDDARFVLLDSAIGSALHAKHPLRSDYVLTARPRDDVVNPHVLKSVNLVLAGKLPLCGVWTSHSLSVGAWVNLLDGGFGVNGFATGVRGDGVTVACGCVCDAFRRPVDAGPGAGVELGNTGVSSPSISSSLSLSDGWCVGIGWVLGGSPPDVLPDTSAASDSRITRSWRFSVPPRQI